MPRKYILGRQILLPFYVLHAPRLWGLGIPRGGERFLPQEVLLLQSILALDKEAAQDTQAGRGPYLKDPPTCLVFTADPVGDSGLGQAW